MKLDESITLAQMGYLRLLGWTSLLAIPIGLLTVGYVELVHQGELIYHALMASVSMPQWSFPVLVGGIGGLLVGGGLLLLGDVVESDHEHFASYIEQGRAPYKGLLILLITAIIGIFSGASVGPEGPLGYTGAGIGAWLAEKRGYSREKSRLLSLGGVSAVFGAFLGTPISAAFMTLEFTHQLTVPLYTNLIVTTVAGLFGAMVMFLLRHGPAPGTTGYPLEGSFTVINVLWALGLGVVGLLWALLFKVVYTAVKKGTAPLDRYPLFRPMVGGLAFGAIGAWMPHTLFSGQYQLSQLLEEGAQLGAALLLLLAVLKLITLSISLSTGFPGGFVFPVFFSAGALGIAIHLMLPFIPMSVAVLGTLAGVAGAVMRMPFTVVLLLAVVSAPSLLPVNIIAALTSFMLATFLHAGSARRAMEESQGAFKKIYLREEPDVEDSAM